MTAERENANPPSQKSAIAPYPTSHRRPTLLDTFCKAGGAAVGYYRAGFDVTGVDIEPQPNYPFDFIQGDALAYILAHGREYDAIHASPPCQRYSTTQHIKGREESVQQYALLLNQTRNTLEWTGVPWVMENVIGAPMRNGVTLCGATFGLKVYRHRMFESSIVLLAPPHLKHRHRINPNSATRRLAYYGEGEGGFVTVAGHLFNRAQGSAAMGIDWMTRDELAEAIPPAMTEFIGRQLLAVLSRDSTQEAAC